MGLKDPCISVATERDDEDPLWSEVSAEGSETGFEVLTGTITWQGWWQSLRIIHEAMESMSPGKISSFSPE